ncbi:unnamed protein product [Phytophthora fragariaefolia]|uniref:Unnamed protein product n=1 Tax=Phytophthora fragariaefolia TaxID=1490495 RepID=A0A9W6TZC2_9STRA|nr:unnamed protein product [Phytophthora fragariaefolia]
MAAAQDTQKEQSDHQGRKNTQVFQLGDQVLLSAKNRPTQAVSAVGSTKLRPRVVGPFTAIGVHGHAYTLDLPPSMATHPTVDVGLLKPYLQAGAVEPAGSTASPSTDERRPLSPERTVPREPGQERKSERQPEPLCGVRLASTSGPPGHTDSGSRRGAPPKSWRTDPSFSSPCERRSRRRSTSSPRRHIYPGNPHTWSRRRSESRRTFWSLSRWVSTSWTRARIATTSVHWSSSSRWQDS